MSEYIEHDKTGLSVGVVDKKLFTFAQPPGELTLENGSTLGPVTLAYETYGELNPEKSNAVLIMHALSGDSHVAGYYSNDEAKPGWWEIMVGPGKGIDTNKYFVVDKLKMSDIIVEYLANFIRIIVSIINKIFYTCRIRMRRQIYHI